MAKEAKKSKQDVKHRKAKAQASDSEVRKDKVKKGAKKDKKDKNNGKDKCAEDRKEKKAKKKKDKKVKKQGKEEKEIKKEPIKGKPIEDGTERSKRRRKVRSADEEEVPTELPGGSSQEVSREEVSESPGDRSGGLGRDVETSPDWQSGGERQRRSPEQESGADRRSHHAASGASSEEAPPSQGESEESRGNMRSRLVFRPLRMDEVKQPGKRPVREARFLERDEAVNARPHKLTNAEVRAAEAHRQALEGREGRSPRLQPGQQTMSPWPPPGVPPMGLPPGGMWRGPPPRLPVPLPHPMLFHFPPPPMGPMFPVPGWHPGMPPPRLPPPGMGHPMPHRPIQRNMAPEKRPSQSEAKEKAEACPPEEADRREDSPSAEPDLSDIDVADI
eukprot:TRINITY_DN30078_c0_g1_i16.p1 TRINITY_DN30078_c0_g1~~TRINITY_DN30078_c0_g1_i16.p1  ORF type:complete len:389 (-),score=99.33 TRINITY_DN30078_c0_g1_i16:175-1341(-)